MSEAKAKIIEHPQKDESAGFDNRVHIKDAKTGKLIRLQHYTKHMRGQEVLFERPPGSGNCFHENGTPAGRYEFPLVGREVMWNKVSEDHVKTKQAPANQIEYLEQENEALHAELEALRSEAKAKQAGQKAPTVQKG